MAAPGAGHGLPAATPRRPNPVVVAAIFAAFGAIVWTIVGVLSWSAASGFGPRVTEEARILSIDTERGSGTGSSRPRSSRWVEGETESGRTWRMASAEAYAVAEREGYPMEVEVLISAWTGNALALRGDGFEVDRSGGVGRVVWLGVWLAASAGALGLAWLCARRESVLAAASYVLLSPLWLWVGFALMRAYRT